MRVVWGQQLFSSFWMKMRQALLGRFTLSLAAPQNALGEPKTASAPIAHAAKFNKSNTSDAATPVRVWNKHHVSSQHPRVDPFLMSLPFFSASRDKLYLGLSIYLSIYPLLVSPLLSSSLLSVMDSTDVESSKVGLWLRLVPWGGRLSRRLATCSSSQSWKHSGPDPDSLWCWWNRGKWGALTPSPLCLSVGDFNLEPVMKPLQMDACSVHVRLAVWFLCTTDHRGRCTYIGTSACLWREYWNKLSV